MFPLYLYRHRSPLYIGCIVIDLKVLKVEVFERIFYSFKKCFFENFMIFQWFLWFPSNAIRSVSSSQTPADGGSFWHTINSSLRNKMECGRSDRNREKYKILAVRQMCGTAVGSHLSTGHLQPFLRPGTDFSKSPGRAPPSDRLIICLDAGVINILNRYYPRTSITIYSNHQLCSYLPIKTY